VVHSRRVDMSRAGVGIGRARHMARQHGRLRLDLRDDWPGRPLNRLAAKDGVLFFLVLVQAV
jgi:hypothetical protein